MIDFALIRAARALRLGASWLDDIEAARRIKRMRSLFPVGAKVRLVLSYEDADAAFEWTITRYNVDADDFLLERPRQGSDPLYILHPCTYARADVLRRIS